MEGHKAVRTSHGASELLVHNLFIVSSNSPRALGCLQDAYPEIIVVSDDNALLVAEGKHITLYSPSMVMEALAVTDASCMLFLRSDSDVQYKGTYKASHVDIAKRAPYHTFSAEVRPLFPLLTPDQLLIKQPKINQAFYVPSLLVTSITTSG